MWGQVHAYLKTTKRRPNRNLIHVSLSVVLPSPLSFLGHTFEQIIERFADEEINTRVAEMDINTGALGYDGWGGSREAVRKTLTFARFLYRYYFRVDAAGLENVPEGRCLLIGNHAGQLPLDGLIVAAALALDGNPPRYVHAMIERFFAYVPFVNIGLTRVGQQIGIPQHAERLLTRENAAVLVFPEGQRGSGRVIWDRYKLLRFGQGFLRLALKTNTPIVPFGFVGSEEMQFSFARNEGLARILGVPYLPATPTPFPLPVKCMLRIGEPLYFEGTGNEEDLVINGMVDEVKASIAKLIDDGRKARRGRIFGR